MKEYNRQSDDVQPSEDNRTEKVLKVTLKPGRWRKKKDNKRTTDVQPSENNRTGKVLKVTLKPGRWRKKKDNEQTIDSSLLDNNWTFSSVTLNSDEQNLEEYDFLNENKRSLDNNGTISSVILDSEENNLEEYDFLNVNKNNINSKNESSKYSNGLQKNSSNIFMITKSLEDLQIWSKDKNLQLISNFNDIRNVDSKVMWKCLDCNCEFENSITNLKRNKIPCPNCRKKHKNVHRKGLIRKNKYYFLNYDSNGNPLNCQEKKTRT